LPVSARVANAAFWSRRRALPGRASFLPQGRVLCSPGISDIGQKIKMTAKDRRDEMPVLVVDLDGTLIRTDTLYECFWAGMSDNWRTFFTALSGLRAGRAVLKRKLEQAGRVDVASLPYNETVLDYVRDWRASGGRAALVTAADEVLARRVAEHLQLFDEVHGSDGATNLKGAEKAELLDRRFGETGYVYVGDSPSDLSVWKGARKAVTVDAPASLRRKAAQLGVDCEDLGAAARPAYFAAFRPHQWLKNVLVFLPVFAAHSYAPEILWQALLAFVAFSLVSSTGYVFNDLMDLRADRAHPRKCRRPLASGRVPIAHATFMLPVLFLAGLGLAALSGPGLLGLVAGYFVLTTTYSSVLKQRAIADIGTLAGLYTLRIIAGGVATGLGLSVWLLAFSMFFFFALAAVKRMAELVDLQKRGATVAKRRNYNVEDLPVISQMTTASGFISVLVLALYLNSPAVQQLYTAPWVLWGICLVLMYWISRIVLITHRGKMLDDPIVFALRDRTSLVCVALVAGFAVGAAAL